MANMKDFSEDKMDRRKGKPDVEDVLISTKPINLHEHQVEKPSQQSILYDSD